MIDESTTRRVLRYLLANGRRTADEVGGACIERRYGRISSAWGGGDYAAQMLLGKLRKAGLVRDASRPDDRVTWWEITPEGRKWL